MKKVVMMLVVAVMLSGCTFGGGFGVGTGGASIGVGTGVRF